MHTSTALQNAIEALGVEVRKDVSLAQLSTFKAGGTAALLAKPISVGQLSQLLTLCNEYGSRYFILGKGSNLLFADAGFDGVLVQLGGTLAGLTQEEGSTVKCGAGASLAEVCRTVAGWGLGGMEFAFGIPGSVGGAIYMNAGAYGGEIGQVIKTVTYLTKTGEEKTISAQECAFAYRNSIFQKEEGCILSCTFNLEPANSTDVLAQMNIIMQKRAEKQPLNLPSMGSAFKRPQGAYAAALIEQCGLKGYRVGGAAISEKHTGFIVNLGGATAADVISLAEYVAKTVYEKTGYVLEREFQVVE
ncbi:UDP-N-acetylmuramate dehydrogenase [Ruminococcaceae bacterium OttesenSCG-928-N02]|nr:UDP-N-acetylmuramate dehydrogenase [Ruminococcaceae bacterium OttesenSCG-928-N02]